MKGLGIYPGYSSSIMDWIIDKDRYMFSFSSRPESQRSRHEHLMKGFLLCFQIIKAERVKRNSVFSQGSREEESLTIHTSPLCGEIDLIMMICFYNPNSSPKMPQPGAVALKITFLTYRILEGAKH